MKINNLLLIVLVFLPIVSGCSHQGDNSQNGVVTLDFTRDYEGITLNLSDMVKDISIIRLETNENSLMSYFKGFVGDKYILSFGRKSIKLFSSEGKFIQTIINRGKGPREFGYIDMWTVDEDEHFYYCHDAGKNDIYKYNLDKRKFEDNIPFSDNGHLSGMVIVNDTTFAILTNSYSSYKYQCFYQTFSGRVLDGIVRDSVSIPKERSFKHAVFMNTKNRKDIVLQPASSDTLYYLSGIKKIPSIYLKNNVTKISGSTKTGDVIELYNFIEDKVLLSKKEFVMEKKSNHIFMSVKNGDTYIANTLSEEINVLDSIYYESIGAWLDPKKILRSNNNRFICSYDAISFRAILKNAIDDVELTEEKRRNVRNLFDKITDDDNPVLITGKYK